MFISNSGNGGSTSQMSYPHDYRGCWQWSPSLFVVPPPLHVHPLPWWLDLAKASCPKWRRRWHPTPVLLPGKSHGWRSLEGCSPWGREESDTTEWLHFHFSLSCIGEGNGNPLQCSCLENSRDGGAWWAAVYGVAQSWTQLKQLSSSSSNCPKIREVVIMPLWPNLRLTL